MPDIECQPCQTEAPHCVDCGRPVVDYDDSDGYSACCGEPVVDAAHCDNRHDDDDR